MKTLYNDLGQPVGFPLPDWNPPQFPEIKSMQGYFCQLEPINDSHLNDLYEAFCKCDEGTWTYLPYGPFAEYKDFEDWAKNYCFKKDPQFYAVVDKKCGKAVGMISYLRITPAFGCVEVGHVHFSMALRKTPAATETMFLLMDNAFSMGYRRYEWKCDALNQPSCNAAERLGFIFEGIFRQAIVYKGRNRDTAWYSITDLEYAKLKPAYERWLDAANFDENGNQKTSLREFIADCR